MDCLAVRVAVVGIGASLELDSKDCMVSFQRVFISDPKDISHMPSNISHFILKFILKFIKTQTCWLVYIHHLVGHGHLRRSNHLHLVFVFSDYYLISIYISIIFIYKLTMLSKDAPSQRKSCENFHAGFFQNLIFTFLKCLGSGTS